MLPIKNIPDDNLVEVCSTKLIKEKSLNIERKAKLSSILISRKKASRNMFVSPLGYSMLSKRVTAKDVISVVLMSE